MYVCVRVWGVCLCMHVCMYVVMYVLSLLATNHQKSLYVHAYLAIKANSTDSHSKGRNIFFVQILFDSGFLKLKTV